MGTEIIGLGHYAPQRCVGNGEIEARLGLEAGWIFKRTGIERRRYAAEGEALSDMAVNAGKMAIAAAGLNREKVALVLLATSTPDHLLPPSAPLVAHRLGLTCAGGIDLAGACAGFIYSLTLADAFVRAHNTPVLVIAANILSRRINPAERASAVLFSDAAGAVLLAPTPRHDAGLLGAKLASDGSAYGLITIPGGGSVRPFDTIEKPEEMLMAISDGQAVFAKAVAMMTGTSREALSAASIEAADVAHLIPHQANARMMDKVGRKLAIAPERTVSTVADFANSSAATIPFTLSYCANERRYARGDKILMCAAGAGLTGGAVAFGW